MCVHTVALVATSASKLGEHDTGLWLEELACPYYEFESAGFEIIIASPMGGAVPIDAASMQTAFFTEPAKKFMHDATAIGKLSHSIKVSDLDLDSLDALFMCGGHGTCSDFINQPSLKNAIETCFNRNNVVAAVCHGPMCLTDCVKADGSPLVSGFNVTGFTNTEEEAVQLTGIVPFLLEDKLKELGGNYERADDWNSKVVVDRNLVTGQNPQSSEECAKAVIASLA
ncbi:unnamed protein product [Heterosigma akashiwo]